MELFIYEHCPFCCRALMIVGLKQLDVDIGIIMEGDVETPTRMVGRKVVPILRRPDGSHMPESMDIVHYLDQSAVPVLVQRGGDDAIDAWVEHAWPLMLRSLTIVKGIGFGANSRRYLDAISARCRVALFDDKAA